MEKAVQVCVKSTKTWKKNIETQTVISSLEVKSVGTQCGGEKHDSYNREEKLKHWTYDRLRDEIIQWCLDEGLIAKSRLCCHCDQPIKLVKCEDRSDKYKWECRKSVNGKRHKVEISIRKGSWFDKSNMTLEEVLKFTYWWCRDVRQEEIRHEFNIAAHTAVDPHKITGLWTNYFEDLHEFKRYENENIFDSGFLMDIESEIHRMDLLEDESDTVLAQPFALCEVNQVIYDLPNGKSPSFDKICYEHVKYGGPNLLHHIVLLFIAIVCVEHIPLSFKLAVKVPIPKDITGNKTFDNHRGISLMPVLDKILQKLVSNRILAVPNCKIHRLQGA
jgi:hypothetical protein